MQDDFRADIRPKTKHWTVSIELIALGLLAALIVVLALPIFADVLGPKNSGPARTEYSLPR